MEDDARAPDCWLLVVAVKSIELDHQMLPIVLWIVNPMIICAKQLVLVFRQVSDLSLLQKEKTKMLG